MTEIDPPVGGGLPWKWLILLPVIASVIAGLSTLAIAIRYADRPLPQMVSSKGPVQFGGSLAVDRARSLGISASATLDPAAHGIVLKLVAADLPATLKLRLWHPTEAGLDQVAVLTRGDDGYYRGVWPAHAEGLLLLLSAADSSWEIPGALDSAANSLRFQP